MPSPIPYPDEDAAYWSLSRPGLSLWVTKIIWLNGDGNGKGFPHTVYGITSNGRRWFGAIEAFWDSWIHQDLVANRKER